MNRRYRVGWYEYVSREVLKSEEVRKLVHDSCKDGDIVRSMVSCSIWNVVREALQIVTSRS